MRTTKWILMALSLVGCSGSAVPSLTPADLSAPKMAGLEPRTIDIKVTDRRKVTVEEQRATEKNPVNAISESLRRENIVVGSNSPNVLAITLTYPEHDEMTMDAKSCVEMVGELRQREGAVMFAKTLGCAEFRNFFGISYGSYVTAAFQKAADTLLKYLDEGFNAATVAPVFVSNKIDVTEFANLGVASLRLQVVDEYSKDGSVGRNLLTELTASFTKAGVKIDEKASQSLRITLTLPNENFAGRSRLTCIAMTARAQLGHGIAFGNGTACRGSADTNHHRVFNDMLQALSVEYRKLIER